MALVFSNPDAELRAACFTAFCVSCCARVTRTVGSYLADAPCPECGEEWVDEGRGDGRET